MLSVQLEPMTCTVQMAEAWCKNNFISYKNILQEYCQKKFLPVPNYKSENTPHGLRGTVSFGSEMMKSEVLMPSPKEADQRVAFEALKNIGVLPADAVFNERCPVELPCMLIELLPFYGGDLRSFKKSLISSYLL